MIICPIDGTKLSEGQSQCPTCGEDLSSLFRLMQLPRQLYNEGLRLAKSGELDAAVEALTAAASLAPDLAEPRVVLGKIYAQQGRYNEAIASWRQALALDPDNQKARAGIHAAEALQQAAQADARRTRALGRILAATGVVVALLVGFSLSQGWQALNSRRPAPAWVLATPTPELVLSEPASPELALPEPAPAPPLDRIRQALNADPLGVYRLEVQPADNGVRLIGTVPSLALKTLAEQRVKAIEGVTLVDSTELRVVPPPLAEAVQVALADDPTASSLDLTVEAAGEEGVILRGTVPSVEAKWQVEVLARSVPGVRFVDGSDVAVVPLSLADQVLAALQSDPDLALLAIEVEQRDHHIRLKGTLPQPELKARAEALAKGIAGVELVDSHDLVVVPPPLAEAVAQALAADPQTAGLVITVEQVDDDIRLSGTVPSAELKRQVEAIVQAVPGVLLVDSSGVTVVPPPLAAKVLAALRADPDLVSLPIEVEQRENNIRLKGTVPHPDLRIRAESLAKGVAGVELVDSSELKVVLSPKVEYEVQPGDTLWAIALHFYGDANAWRRIYEANRDRIADPGLIWSGTQLRIPQATQRNCSVTE